MKRNLEVVVATLDRSLSRISSTLHRSLITMHKNMPSSFPVGCQNSVEKISNFYHLLRQSEKFMASILKQGLKQVILCSLVLCIFWSLGKLACLESAVRDYQSRWTSASMKPISSQKMLLFHTYIISLKTMDLVRLTHISTATIVQDKTKIVLCSGTVHGDAVSVYISL